MIKVIIALSSLAAIGFFSCNKESSRVTNYNLIIGSWKLVEAKSNGVIVSNCDERFTFRIDQLSNGNLDSVLVFDNAQVGNCTNMGFTYGPGNGTMYWRLVGSQIHFLDLTRNRIATSPPIISVENQILVFGVDNNNTRTYQRY
jgi:hypothetical protein